MQQNGSSSGAGPKRVVVVGGGPAGLLAAGTAASLGAQATILEKMDRPGRKLSLAGCGRRVLTNLAPLEQYLNAYGPNGKFLHPALLNFASIDLAAFVESLGVSIEVERSGRFLATEDQMAALTTALTKWAAEKGVDILTDSAAMNLQVENGKTSGVLVSTKMTVPAESVVLATGGRSYPETGSTGDGYTLAEAVGHRIVPTRPALVPLETKGDVASRLQGLSLHDVATRLLINDHCEDDLVGDVTFTSFGLSGSVILHLSRRAVDALQTGGKVEIGLDLVTAMDERTLEARLVSSFNDKNDSALHDIVEDLLPPKLTAVVLEAVDLSGNTIGAQVTPAERRRLRHVLKDFRLRVTGHRPWDEAIITAGGVSLDEVDPRTMQSRLVKGLYFAGEVLDIDGPSGGYNLQAAFSTGRLAGQSAATEI